MLASMASLAPHHLIITYISAVLFYGEFQPVDSGVIT